MPTVRHAAASGLTVLAVLLGASPAQAVDIEPPLINITPAGNQWFLDTTTLAVGVTDPGGSVGQVEYALEGAHEGNGFLGRSGGDITLTASGVTTITITAEDREQNTAQHSLWVGIDRDDPAVTVHGPANGAEVVLDSTTQLTYTCADPTAGLASCSGTVPSNGFLDTSTLGEHTAQITAVDRAGRSSTTTVSYTVVRGSFAGSAQADIAGDVRVDSTVTAVPPAYTPEPTGYTYQWQLAGADIHGATASTYRPGPGDAGQMLAVRVTASRPGYDDRSSTSLSRRVDQATFGWAAAPTVVGEPVVGNLLSGSVPVTPEPTGVEWRWYVGGVHRSSDPSYRVQLADLGQPIVLEAQVSRAGYQNATRQSEPTTQVRPADQDPGVSATLIGDATVGRELEVSMSPLPDGATAELQWLADGVPVAGATGARYRITPEDLGASLAVEVTVRRPGFNPWRLTTDPLGPVGPGTIAPGGPVAVSGEPVVGQVLTGSAADLPAGISADYQWLADGQPLTGGTGRTLALEPHLVGRRLSLRVSAASPGYQTWTATSAPTATVSRAVATLAVRARSGRVTGTRRTVKVIVTVQAAGLRPSGTVTLQRGRRIVARGVVDANGTVRFKAKRQPRKKVAYTVVYGGDQAVAPAGGQAKVAHR